MKKTKAMFGILLQSMGQFAKGLIPFLTPFGPAVQIVGQAFGLKHGTVLQEDGTEFHRGFGAEDIPLVAFSNQFREPSAVIHVGMGQENQIDGGRVETQAGFLPFGAHFKAAIDQNFEAVAELQQVHAAGDLLSRPPGS